MSKNNNRTVYRNKQEKWVNKKNANTRATSLHDTQKEAEAEARKMISQDGGGELTTMGIKGRIVSKDTIPPGSDPNPPKDKEH